jgi:hypothetical protein
MLVKTADDRALIRLQSLPGGASARQINGGKVMGNNLGGGHLDWV